MLPITLSSATAWGLAGTHVLLASLVTIDVLLKKSDVRGAIGWIAASWFSPILGSLIYYMFGINRVTRRASRFETLRDAQVSPPGPSTLSTLNENIALLSSSNARVTDSPLIAGNHLEIFQGGDAAYPAMLAAIEGAQSCVALASYVFRNDAAGQAFSDALIAANRRGVVVRVLLDSVGIGYFFPLILYRLQTAGVQAARFLHTWLPWRMPFINMRNHRKLLIVDGAVAFMGGMNVGAENSQNLEARNYIEDIHFRCQGPVVRLIMDAFARDWAFTTNEVLDQSHWWPTLGKSGSVFARGLRSGPDADIYKLEMVLGAALTLARKQVRIVTPYFLPDQRLQFAIAQACQRGVKVDIVIPEHCNYIFMDWAMRGHLRFFNHISANIYLTPLPFDHSKLATVDGEWSLVGSSNWDARSLRLNFEYNLECYNTELAEALDMIIDAKIARARQLSCQELAERPVLLRLRDAAARLFMPYL